MNHAEANTHQCAVIYARVSSAAQTKRGDGLGSQETRCREFARMKGYEVMQVFTDDVTGSLATRPGMQSMLSFLQENRSSHPIVLIDDVSRLARGLEAHLQLRSAIGDAGGRLESPSIEFGEDNDSILVENLLASVSQHQRQKNAEQTKNRMRARILNGFWCFQAPLGYRYTNKAGCGRVLVRDEPHASILQEALEGFASGRFGSQAEVRRFLESRPDFKQTRNGKVHPQRVLEHLTRPVYAGLVEAPKWKLAIREGQHEGLISVETFNRIQERLNRTTKAPARKDLNIDFPLRGAVSCADCNKPLTACWSSGKKRKYPYYSCYNRNCVSKRKSIPRDKIEDEFTSLLKTMVPTKELFTLMRDLFSDVWDQRLSQSVSMKGALNSSIADIDKQIDSLQAAPILGAGDCESVR